MQLRAGLHSKHSLCSAVILSLQLLVLTITKVRLASVYYTARTVFAVYYYIYSFVHAAGPSNLHVYMHSEENVQLI